MYMYVYNNNSPGVGQRLPLLASTRVKGILLRPFFLWWVGAHLRTCEGVERSWR